jgi:hypothetical protein
MKKIVMVTVHYRGKKFTTQCLQSIKNCDRNFGHQ